MLSVFKLVLCKHGASRELEWKSSKCSKLIVCNIIIVIDINEYNY